MSSIATIVVLSMSSRFAATPHATFTGRYYRLADAVADPKAGFTDLILIRYPGAGSPAATAEAIATLLPKLRAVG